jgi:hypothetical protein
MERKKESALRAHRECHYDQRVADHYGVTCGGCGLVLEGYGYGGWFGSNLTGKEQCVHAEWYQISGRAEVCPYCHEILKVIS